MKDIKVIDPLDCWEDFKVMPDVNGSIGNFVLETRSGSKAKGNIMVNVKEAIKLDDEISFMIRFHGDSVICIFHIQCSSLSAQWGSCDLRENFGERKKKGHENFKE